MGWCIFNLITDFLVKSGFCKGQADAISDLPTYVVVNIQFFPIKSDINKNYDRWAINVHLSNLALSVIITAVYIIMLC